MDAFKMKLYAGSLLVLAGSCGDKRASGKMAIANLTTQTALNQLIHPMADALTDLPASSGNYSFAKVDGIKVTVTQFRGADAKSDNPLLTVDVNEEIELTDDPNALLALEKAVDWVVGDYSGIDLRLANGGLHIRKLDAFKRIKRFREIQIRIK